ncbi:MAG: trypsin-like peptidase domain-containing protein [Gammaproteobacteria bacterium]|nr:trypsin-like peptidase domain-containing protein [Gammaproteobacteria bacterium]
MPIPNDPKNRDWLDVSSANPKLVDEFRPCLVGFLAFDHGQVPGLAGTGFVTSSFNFAPNKTIADLALVITAKHVLTEGVLKIQRPDPRHAPSALFIPASAKTPLLHEEKLRAVWMGHESGDLLYARHLTYHDSSDIACCLLTPQEEYATQFAPAQIPLDTTRPSVGDVVHMVSQGGRQITDADRLPPTGAKGIGQQFTVRRRVSIRIGTVTAIYPQGFRQYPWQCFTTSIPVEPGMSGGFVYLPRDGKQVAACGIVCADNSTREAHTDYSLCGESVIACAWPALALKVPEYYENDAPLRTLLDMMKMGKMEPAIGGIDHIQIIDRDDGGFTIKRSD